MSNFVFDEVSAHVSTTDSANCTRATSHSNTDKPLVQSSELDSSILAPYLESTALDSDETFPYTSTADKSLHPFSSEFFQKLLDALGLDAPWYAHVPSNVLCQFKSLLYRYQHVFHLPDSPLSTIKGFSHSIPTGDSPPVYRLPNRKSPAELAAIKTEIERMLKLKVIRPSHSAWGAPCILVRKPLEKGKRQPPRFVVDYRGLNAVTSGDGYPIPSVSNILDSISGGKLFAKLDLASGYWQIPVNPAHIHKAAFATHLGLWEFLKMPFGLKTAGQTFQHVLNTVFSDYLYQWLIIYVDDCISWSSSYAEALTHYEKIFERASQFCLQFKPSKCEVFSQELQVLGHKINTEGRFPTDKGTDAISRFPRPHNVSALKRFLGMVGYFWEYTPNMASKTPHLRALLSKEASFSWSDQHEAEFL